MAAAEAGERIQVDVVIAGGGLVGLTLGVALAGAGIETAVVDGAPPAAMKDDAFDGRGFVDRARFQAGAGRYRRVARAR